jgi:hypothetical protein
MARKHDGIDVAIAAFLGARLSGRSVAEAEKDAKAMLDFFGIPRKDTTNDHRGG